MPPRTRTVTVVRPGTLDPTTGDRSPETRTTTRMTITPRESTDTDDHGRRIVVGVTGWSTDPDLDVRATDMVEIAGELWEVDGEPHRHRPGYSSRRGGGCEVLLTRRAPTPTS